MGWVQIEIAGEEYELDETQLVGDLKALVGAAPTDVLTYPLEGTERPAEGPDYRVLSDRDPVSEIPDGRRAAFQPVGTSFGAVA